MAPGGFIHSHYDGHDHHHGHSHGHSHSSADANLRFAFSLNLLFAIVELIGGVWTNSIAISSNALHDFGDSFALGISWYMERVAHRGRDSQYSYGYRRYSPLGALIHALILIMGALIILSQTLPRLVHPQPVRVGGMLGFAVIGVAVNFFAALRLLRGHSLNENVARWHLIEDVLGWLAVLVTASVMYFWDLPILDPLLSFLVVSWVLWNVAKRFRETVQVFLQAVPSQVELANVEAEIRALPSVMNVHHTHLWSLDGYNHILTTHVVVESVTTKEQSFELKRRIKEKLRHFAIQDATIEIEFETEECPSKEAQ